MNKFFTKLFNMLILILTAAIIVVVLFSSADPYVAGWDDGYCEGWKDVKGQEVVCPVSPVAPVAEANCNTYKCGYNRGFKKGKGDAED